MRELALFAGAGGGLLGSRLAGWTTVAACEIDPRCRDILFARQRDRCLEPFPIWDDVGTLDARPWRGLVDLVSGGFPCQPFSTAARGRNVARDRWPDMLRIVSETAARYVLGENVQRAPIERAACDLLRLGYHCTIFYAPAAAVGAAHRRDRWWVAADAHGSLEHVLEDDGQVARLCPSASPVWARDPRSDPDMAHGVASGVDVYTHAVGNGQVPQVVKAIAVAMGWSGR